MNKSKQKLGFRRTINFSDVVIDGDLVVKSTLLARESRKPGSGLPRIHGPEDLLEMAFEETVDKFEKMLGKKIVIAESGLSAHAKEISDNGEDRSEE